MGFPGDAYVLAFVGGTGVGKSSLLNALAGETVSPASVRRPTTSVPVAWVPAAERTALEPLLEWLGVDEVREHGATDLGPVAILDLPDMDSVATEHRGSGRGDPAARRCRRVGDRSGEVPRRRAP